MITNIYQCKPESYFRIAITIIDVATGPIFSFVGESNSNLFKKSYIQLSISMREGFLGPVSCAKNIINHCILNSRSKSDLKNVHSRCFSNSKIIS